MIMSMRFFPRSGVIGDRERTSFGPNKENVGRKIKVGKIED